MRVDRPRVTCNTPTRTVAALAGEGFADVALAAMEEWCIRQGATHDQWAVTGAPIPALVGVPGLDAGGGRLATALRLRGTSLSLSLIAGLLATATLPRAFRLSGTSSLSLSLIAGHYEAKDESQGGKPTGRAQFCL
jgi:hypothetical protein